MASSLVVIESGAVGFINSVKYLDIFESVHFLRDKMEDFRLKFFDSKLRAFIRCGEADIGARADFMSKPRQGLVPATSGAPS